VQSLWVSGSSSVLGLDERFSFGVYISTATGINPPTDAAHFYESAFFKESDPKSGLGSWGDASTQFHVLSSGFFMSSSFWPSYPSRTCCTGNSASSLCLSRCSQYQA
jgi:hypothetical protein